ncbi:MAG: acylphosphatase [Thermoplasmata archaeon]
MQIHIIFRGIVQGIGFRERTRRMAKSLNIRGWIKNNVDGSVEGIFQGTPEDIEKLINFCENSIPDAMISEKILEYMKEEDLDNFKIIR